MDMFEFEKSFHDAFNAAKKAQEYINEQTNLARRLATDAIGGMAIREIVRQHDCVNDLAVQFSQGLASIASAREFARSMKELVRPNDFASVREQIEEALKLQNTILSSDFLARTDYNAIAADALKQTFQGSYSDLADIGRNIHSFVETVARNRISEELINTAVGLAERLPAAWLKIEIPNAPQSPGAKRASSGKRKKTATVESLLAELVAEQKASSKVASESLNVARASLRVTRTNNLATWLAFILALFIAIHDHYGEIDKAFRTGSAAKKLAGPPAKVIQTAAPQKTIRKPAKKTPKSVSAKKAGRIKK